jgi:SAM-dependent methyltransferase
MVLFRAGSDQTKIPKVRLAVCHGWCSKEHGEGAWRMSAANLGIYNRPDVAAHYAELHYLTACELLLFDLYIKPGAAILDVGVGGGRTTAYLSGKASRYVGVDYAEEMIRTCRQKYPSLQFLVAEASDLSAFETSSFDAVICAFNGLDYVLADRARSQCFKECRRVLKPEGILLFSSHNPRSILVRPLWNRANVRRVADRVGRRGGFTGEAVFLLLNLAAAVRAFVRAAWATAGRLLTRAPSRAFRHGEGCLYDSAHGGLTTHCGVPGRVIAGLERHGFRPLRVLGDDYPAPSREYWTDWYYYVFSNLKPAGDGEACA